MNKNNIIFKGYSLITGKNITEIKTYTSLFFNVLMAYITFAIFMPFYVLIRLIVKYVIKDEEGVDWRVVLLFGVFSIILIPQIKLLNGLNIYLSLNLSVLIMLSYAIIVIFITTMFIASILKTAEFINKTFKIKLTDKKIKWK